MCNIPINNRNKVDGDLMKIVYYKLAEKDHIAKYTIHCQSLAMALACVPGN